MAVAKKESERLATAAYIWRMARTLEKEIKLENSFEHRRAQYQLATRDP